MKEVLIVCVIAILLGVGLLLVEPTSLPTYHPISTEKADEYFENYQIHKDNGTLQFVDKEYWRVEEVLFILEIDGAERFYVKKGADSEGKEASILYTTDGEGNIVSIYLQNAIPCPPYCDREAL